MRPAAVAQLARPTPAGRILRRVVDALAAFVLAAVLVPAAQARDCPPQPTPPSAQRLAQAQAAARDRGFLWSLRKGGHTSFLYGTIHLGRLEWVPPGPTIREALARAEVLALELDVNDPATQRQLQAMLAPKPSDHAVAPDLRERLAHEAERACLPRHALEGQPPALQALTLVVLAARWEGLDAAYAQEAALGAYARSHGLPVVALESVEQQLAALLPDTVAETHRFIEQALQQLRSGAARRTSRRLAQAWAQGALDDLANYEQWCQCIGSEEDRRMLRRLNDERNPALAERIARLHDEGRVVFAGVGALHMTGPMALPRLLQQSGFEVRRVELPR